MSRRTFVRGTAGLTGAVAVGGTVTTRLTARPVTVDLGTRVVDSGAYGAQVPDPLRATAGDLLRVQVNNELPAETSVHWYGLALRNDMDGVPHLTQDPDVFSARPGQRVRPRIVNAGSDTAFRVALGGHRMTVSHCDGFPIVPVSTDALIVAMGERVDVLVDTATTSCTPRQG